MRSEGVRRGGGCLEGSLVYVAGAVGLAGHLDHDVVFEEDAGHLHYPVDTLSPDAIPGCLWIDVGHLYPGRAEAGTYEVVKEGSTGQVQACVVGPLNRIHLGAIIGDIVSIVELVLFGHEADLASPIPRLHGPVHVCSISRISRQPRGQQEERTIRNGILVMIASIEAINLPAQPTATMLLIPPGCLSVEDSLGER
jgi:hypothetical protein